MHCASCVASVEKALAGISGVQSATVNLATETAQVVFDPVSVTQDDFIKAVSNAGYTVADFVSEAQDALRRSYYVLERDFEVI